MHPDRNFHAGPIPGGRRTYRIDSTRQQSSDHSARRNGKRRRRCTGTTHAHRQEQPGFDSKKNFHLFFWQFLGFNFWNFWRKNSKVLEKIQKKFQKQSLVIRSPTINMNRDPPDGPASWITEGGQGRGRLKGSACLCSGTVRRVLRCTRTPRTAAGATK